MRLRITAIMRLRLRTSGEICKAIGVVTHRYNIADIAKKAGIQRSSLYRAFTGSPNHPNFKSVLSVLDAMGFQLQVTARRDERATPAGLATGSDFGSIKRRAEYEYILSHTFDGLLKSARGQKILSPSTCFPLHLRQRTCGGAPQ